MTTSHPTPSSQTSAAAEPPAADAAPEPKQTVPDASDAVRELLQREWTAHKSLWLGALALMAAVAVVGAWLQGADPYWAGALYNLCTVVLLAALFGFAALGLVWRTVKRMPERSSDALGYSSASSLRQKSSCTCCAFGPPADGPPSCAGGGRRAS